MLISYILAVSSVASSHHNSTFTLLDALKPSEREPFLCKSPPSSPRLRHMMGAVKANDRDIANDESYIAWRGTLAKLVTSVAYDGFVVYNVVNRMYVDWVHLWAWQWKRLLPARNYFLTSLDEQATAECRRRGVAHIHLPESGVFVRRVNRSNAADQTCVFRDVWYRVGIGKLVVLAEIAEMGFSAIFSESDLFWKSSAPLLTLLQAPAVDLHIWKERDFANVGAIAVANTSRAAVFMRTMARYWLLAQLDEKTIDQLVFNILLSPTKCHRVYQSYYLYPAIAADLRSLTDMAQDSRVVRRFEPIRWTFVPQYIITQSIHASGGSGPSKLFGLKQFVQSAFKPQVEETFLTWGSWARGNFSRLSAELAAVMAIGKVLNRTVLYPKAPSDIYMFLDLHRFRLAGFYAKPSWLAPAGQAAMAPSLACDKVICCDEEAIAEQWGKLTHHRVLVLQGQINFAGFTSSAAHEDWVLRAIKGIQWCRNPAAMTKGTYFKPCGGDTFGAKRYQLRPGDLVLNETYDQRPFCPYQGEFSPAP